MRLRSNLLQQPIGSRNSSQNRVITSCVFTHSNYLASHREACGVKHHPVDIVAAMGAGRRNALQQFIPCDPPDNVQPLHRKLSAAYVRVQQINRLTGDVRNFATTSGGVFLVRLGETGS